MRILVRTVERFCSFRPHPLLSTFARRGSPHSSAHSGFLPVTDERVEVLSLQPDAAEYSV